MVSERKNKKLKDVLDKRKLELGIGSKTEDNDIAKDNLIFGEGELEIEKEKLKKLEGKKPI